MHVFSLSQLSLLISIAEERLKNQKKGEIELERKEEESARVEGGEDQKGAEKKGSEEKGEQAEGTKAMEKEERGEEIEYFGIRQRGKEMEEDEKERWKCPSPSTGSLFPSLSLSLFSI